ncbi:class I SAM-dependent methyltransferase [Actinomycetes bacterium KLBMP 9759]
MAKIGDRLLDMGFGRPRGLLGRIGGRLMARGNAETERHLVRLAELGPDDDVLVVGPGPGIGLEAAAATAGHVVGVDPSDAMVAACRRRCAASIDGGVVEVRLGDAAHTGQGDASVDVVLSVNNVMLWPDRKAGFTELHRVLRPGGRMLVSVHEKWLPGGLSGLAAAVAEAGFGDVETWTWEPPGRGATTAAQLKARRE